MKYVTAFMFLIYVKFKKKFLVINLISAIFHLLCACIHICVLYICIILYILYTSISSLVNLLAFSLSAHFTLLAACLHNVQQSRRHAPCCAKSPRLRCSSSSIISTKFVAHVAPSGRRRRRCRAYQM